MATGYDHDRLSDIINLTSISNWLPYFVNLLVFRTKMNIRVIVPDGHRLIYIFIMLYAIFSRLYYVIYRS